MSTVFKALLWLAAAAGLLYLAGCSLMYAQQRKIMYLPQYTQVAADQTNFSLQRPDALLRGWQVHPSTDMNNPTTPVVVYFGGNGEDVRYVMPQLQQALPQSHLYTLSYRGYGASEGEPSEDALVGDALALFDVLRARHAHNPITVIGTSLGSGVAAAVAKQRQPDKLLLVTPFDSALNVARHMLPWLPVSLLLKDRYDSVSRLQSYQGPVLVLRAGSDSVILPVRTDALLSGLQGKSVTVHSYAGADHNTISQQPGFWQAVQSFVLQAAPALVPALVPAPQASSLLQTNQ